MSGAGRAAWLRRLAAPGARLHRLDGSGDGGGDVWGVFPGGDRRRRPLGRARGEQVRAARGDGLIAAAGDGFALTPEGAARLRREEAGDHAAQHRAMATRAVADADGDFSRAAANAAESPLHRWRQGPGREGAGYLDAAEFAAGERFREDYHRSTLSQRMTSDWTAPPGGSAPRAPRGPEDAPLGAIAAKDRVMDALAAAGPGLDRVILAVCVRETGMEAMERELGWPRRAGKAVLKLALERLAVHYGMKRAGRGV